MNVSKFYMNGEWQESNEIVTVLNPKDKSYVGKYYATNKTLIPEIITSSKKALDDWANMPIEKRGNIIQKASDILVREYGDEGKETRLKKLIVDEVGKRLPEADIEVIESSDMLGYFANVGSKVLDNKDIQLNEELWPTKRSYIAYEPVGVIGIIQPWNYPLELPLWAIGSALIAGNTVVFKPSEYSTLVGIEIAKIFDEAGLPKGVLNVVTGNGEIGKLIVENKDIDMIAFTGSHKVGKQINIKCAENFKKVNLELSGNDAAIVCSDADLELAANGIVWGAYCNAGQVCVGAKRIFVHEQIYDDFVKTVKEKTEELRLGIDIGPIINENEIIKIESFIRDAVEKGASLVSGGKREDNYIQPTILANINSTMTLMHEELFGPVLPIIKYSTLSEVIQMANDTQYGLGASIWSKDSTKAKTISQKLQVGMVWINDINVAYPEAPWGSIKASGNGISLSTYGIEKYCNIKHVNYETSNDKTRVWWFPY